MSAAGPQHPLRLAVCACTRSRPVGLARLLDALGGLEPVPAADVFVTIVDNDPAGSGRDVVEARRAGFPLPLRYAHEPAPGIPAARNAAIAAAGDVDALVFVDDDEWPEPHWLRRLVEVWRATGASVVTGTVEPWFAAPPPAWVLEGGFFERPRYPTGTELEYARTSNVLVDGRLLTQEGLRFEHTGSQGGEDTHFFRAARLRGHRIVWADDAVVHEEVPASRISVRWLLARHYRYGLTRSASLRMLGGSPLRYARRAANGALTAVSGLLALPLARTRARRVQRGQRVAVGVGLVAGLFGAGYDDYRVVHGG
ncbi:glycosyltransferase family 2 protein [Quadrisphaera sp. DSM 44207]|uniref:glycosyltransferase n=1 Tax=Quadrisphaera sp. DSM 44207 TaxID=1881057 RepID=UPI00087F1F50|nr:glycosyltransferase family 2 protein [Quadrisphaera sp. DSM 44207]SDQ67035.1 Glycosyl transferase family 2 [Quadrisphaera sp. DSM 44207]